MEVPESTNAEIFVGTASLLGWDLATEAGDVIVRLFVLSWRRPEWGCRGVHQLGMGLAS
jgi:hypothetical protein